MKSFVEQRFPHLVPTLTASWGDQESFEAVMRDLMFDRRGGRIGFPMEAWEELRFTPLRSLRQLTLAHEVPQAWQRREEIEPGNLEAAAAGRPADWVIWRPERTSHFRSLEPDEAAMLAAMIEGQAFPELCESLVAHVGEDAAPAQAAGRLRSWVEEGMIGAFAR